MYTFRVLRTFRLLRTSFLPGEGKGCACYCPKTGVFPSHPWEATSEATTHRINPLNSPQGSRHPLLSPALPLPIPLFVPQPHTLLCRTHSLPSRCKIKILTSPVQTFGSSKVGSSAGRTPKPFSELAQPFISLQCLQPPGVYLPIKSAVGPFSFICSSFPVWFRGFR